MGAFYVGIDGYRTTQDSPFKSWSYCDCIGSWCSVANLASCSSSHYLTVLVALKSLGHNVPRERIRQSFLRIDPSNCLFQRTIIQRREYWVPGPNYLWHHDGQHGKYLLPEVVAIKCETLFSGLIRWGIIIHGFIDGYSRTIVGMRASNNNQANTVLDVFREAVGQWGFPSRVRGDHGTENIKVAAYVVYYCGSGRSSYLWGRYVS